MRLDLAVGVVLNNGQMQVGPVFNPASLFASSEKGVWYDPSDFTTLYADTAGTTAITAVEQPVGLMLDKSQGLVLGSELVPADYTTAWTTVGNITVNSSSIVASASASEQVVATLLTTGPYFYRISFTVSGLSGDDLRLRFGSASSNDAVITASGNYEYILDSTAGNQVAFRSGSGASSWTITNISIKELSGNHAVAANGSTARPVLRNRYNRLLWSEQFDNAAWTKSNATVTANATTAPDGTSTADKLVENNLLADHTIYQLLTLIKGVQYSFSFYAKAAERPGIRLERYLSTLGIFFVATFDLSNGTFSTTGAVDSASIENVGNGWYRCEIKITPDPTTATISSGVRINLFDGSTDNYTGDGTSGIYLWGAQLTTAADHAAIGGEYQRIAAAPVIGDPPTYDSDVAKFPPYLYATTDDAMSTASIDFSGGDEMSVFAGVTKEQDAATGAVVELSAAIADNNGVYNLLAPSQNGSNSYRYSSKGTAQASAGTGVFVTAPDTAVLTGLADISDDVATLRRNGNLVETDTTDQGTGNYGNYPLYLFARNTSSLFYTGRLYSLIVRNALPTADELSGAETYVNSKTRAY